MQKQICNLKICKSRYVEVDMYLEDMYQTSLMGVENKNPCGLFIQFLHRTWRRCG